MWWLAPSRLRLLRLTPLLLLRELLLLGLLELLRRLLVPLLLRKLLWSRLLGILRILGRLGLIPLLLRRLLSPLLLRLSLLRPGRRRRLLSIGFSGGVGSTSFAVIADMTPDVEGDEHHKGNDDNNIEIVEDRAEWRVLALLKRRANKRTNIGKEQTPG